MRLLHSSRLLRILSVLLLSLFTSVARSASSSSTAAIPLTVYAWPLSAPSPTPLTTLTYNPSTLAVTIKSHTPPKLPSSSSSSSDPASPASLIRIGFYDPSTKHWSGIVTAASNFAPGLRPHLALHVDERGDVFGLSLGAERGGEGASAANKDDEGSERRAEDKRVVVELVPRERGPAPVLNKPVVLNADGKLDGKEPEKSFLQKYWWVIALFLVMQVLAGGGGAEK